MGKHPIPETLSKSKDLDHSHSVGQLLRVRLNPDIHHQVETLRRGAENVGLGPIQTFSAHGAFRYQYETREIPRETVSTASRDEVHGVDRPLR